MQTINNFSLDSKKKIEINISNLNSLQFIQKTE